MSNVPTSPIDLGSVPADNVLTGSPEHWVVELGTLLSELEDSTPRVGQPSPSLDDQVARRRLGIATSLFTALQCKHTAAAAHSLRVALSCSTWAVRMKLDDRTREHLEIAALLHDIGVIGAPDRILWKPGRLDGDEAAVMTRARLMSLEILHHSCNSPEILSIVEHVGAWYDGSRTGPPLKGGQIPLCARMIAIVEAFDAMTTDQVFRSALSHERAVAELFRCAGTQFDPELVKQFIEFRESDLSDAHSEVASRWLSTLDLDASNSYWEFNRAAAAAGMGANESLFCGKFLDNMYDAVVFVDASRRVTYWNHGAERLTGVPATSILGRPWSPEVLRLADEQGRTIAEADCPVQGSLQSGVQSLRRLSLCGRNDRRVAVDSHSIPVISAEGATCGAILMLHDASSEISLEQRCQSLAERATRDPLTQVANRAEFDRVHAMFVSAHQQQNVPCSLLMCDLDRFKLVNDTYGHQAGDEAIKSLALLLKGACRAGDLVARYGGEEFVVLFADCDNASATRRAEQVRRSLEQMPQPKLAGRNITASFGVTEIQPGDTPETMLRRADRGLLMAKESGRNRVIQLGSGSLDNGEDDEQKKGFFQTKGQSSVLIQEVHTTPVPLKMAIEKLRGFVADHEATVVKIEPNQVVLEIGERTTSLLRRVTDRPVTFHLELKLEEQRVAKDGSISETAADIVRTRIVATIGVRRQRDRRCNDIIERAKQVLISFRSYLMATLEEQVLSAPDTKLGRVRSIFGTWFGRK